MAAKKKKSAMDRVKARTGKDMKQKLSHGHLSTGKAK